MIAIRALLRDRRRRVAPVAVSLFIILLLVGVALVVRSVGRSDTGPGSTEGLPLLRLSLPSGAIAVDATESGPARDHYVLTRPLRSAQPEPGAVYRFGADPAPADLARRLAGALGLGGTPSRTPTGWQLAVGQRVLTLHDGGGWAWSLGAVDVADSPVKCVRAPCPYGMPDSNSTNRDGLAPPASVAERTAKDALTALGLPAEKLTTTSTGAQVRAPRPVDGKDTDGFGTMLSIGNDRRIYAGNGWLDQPDRGASYPLVSAAEAFKRLQAQPYAEIMLCRPQRGGGCAPTPQVRVTGAGLGLMMAFDSGRLLLIPAWLFTAEGQTDPIGVVAVQSRFLRTSASPLPSTATSGRPSTGGGSTPQSIPPVAPSSLPHPASPKPK